MVLGDTILDILNCIDLAVVPLPYRLGRSIKVMHGHIEEMLEFLITLCMIWDCLANKEEIPLRYASGLLEKCSCTVPVSAEVLMVA